MSDTILVIHQTLQTPPDIGVYMHPSRAPNKMLFDVVKTHYWCRERVVDFFAHSNPNRLLGARARLTEECLRLFSDTPTESKLTSPAGDR